MTLTSLYTYVCQYMVLLNVENEHLITIISKLKQ